MEDINNSEDKIHENNEELTKQVEEEKHSHTEEEKPKKSGMFTKKDKKNQAWEELKNEHENLLTEKAELHDKFLRLYSEFDNYRKRTNKEKLEIIKTASESLILQLLPIIDDMERAIAFNEENNTSDAALIEGFALILQKIKTLLKQKGLEEIVVKDQFFDTDFHEAVTTVPAETKEDKGKILEEIQKGYTLNEKVIRYSKVVIYQ
ncbi:MAG: nucleotide exchange factor GrpE [Bacteroidales bacterium]|nr:nucleotide exchange factor GrpE [Bacteroidales bacterium]